MENSWQEFLKALHSDNETEYGDFKREIDAQLHDLVSSSPPLTEQQARALVKIRDDYVWTDHTDNEIENIKRDISKRILEISQFSV
ncbi:MAG TPA: hypothetical protein VIG33_12075 [Pseudobdellovibrionaceae bacterium]|jgi:hypothetical protein